MVICKECKRDVSKLYSGEFCTLRCQQQYELTHGPQGWKWISLREIDIRDDGKKNDK